MRESPDPTPDAGAPGSDGSGGAGGTGGAGAGAGGGAGGGGVDGAPECGPLETEIAGAPGGVELGATWQPGGIALSGGVQIQFGDYGALYLDGEDVETPNVVHAVGGLLRMPEDSTQAGAWYCAGEGSALLIDEDLKPSVVLRSVSSLGTCPGEPVAGGVEICFPEGGCTPSLASTLAGAAFEAPLEGFVGMFGPIEGPDAQVTATLQGRGGFVTLEATDIDMGSAGAQSSPLGIGFFTIPEGQPDAGAVYCIGAGSTLDYTVDAGFPVPLSATLVDLTRLGACPGAPLDGDIGFCMNLDR